MSRADFVPRPSDATGPYWAAIRERRLVLQWCDDCAAWVHHPREACPRCLGMNLSWRPSTGTGVVHALSVHHRPFPPMSAEDCPYVVAFVDLDDGVRFLATLVEAAPEDFAIGDRVELTWVPAGEGSWLPAFRPAAP